MKEINPNYCIYEWPKKWIGEAYTVTRNVIICLCFPLMVGLYSRVVYTLWFKRNDDNQITYQQQVRDIENCLKKLDHCIMKFQGFGWFSGHGI